MEDLRGLRLWVNWMMLEIAMAKRPSLDCFLPEYSIENADKTRHFIYLGESSFDGHRKDKIVRVVQEQTDIHTGYIRCVTYYVPIACLSFTEIVY